MHIGNSEADSNTIIGCAFSGIDWGSVCWSHSDPLEDWISVDSHIYVNIYTYVECRHVFTPQKDE